MSDNFDNKGFDDEEKKEEANSEAEINRAASEASESEITGGSSETGNEEARRVFRVNEEYIEPESSSQYRYKFEGGEKKHENGTESEPEQQYSYDYQYGSYNEEPKKEPKKNSTSKKVVGVVLAVAVFVLVAGVLMFAAQYISGGSSSSNDTAVSSLTHNSDSSDDGEDADTDTDTDTDADTDTNTDAESETEGTNGVTSLTESSSEISTTTSVSATILDVSDVVEEVMPTVVAVTNTTVYSVSSSYWSWYGSSSSSEQEASGVGSGVILADNGEELLIVTNAHVVNPTDYSDYGYTVENSEITVTFCNDVTVSGVVKGTDDDADLAIIAVDLDDIDDDTKSEIKIATVGNSDELKVGNGVIAIGNALGFGQSVTVGYVSAVNREVTIDDVSRELLQTDAAINPGNSGGGLFDMYGNLIGINSAKYASEDVEGIGYAIPITSVEDIIIELMNQETVIREKVTDEDKAAWLGISADSTYSSFYEGQGAFISSVVEGGPADEAGLMAYDIITGFGDVEITSWDDLLDEIEYHEGGETVTITYYTLVEEGRSREYVERTTEVTLGYKKDATTTTDDTETEE